MPLAAKCTKIISTVAGGRKRSQAVAGGEHPQHFMTWHIMNIYQNPGHFIEPWLPSGFCTSFHQNSKNSIAVQNVGQRDEKD